MVQGVRIEGVGVIGAGGAAEGVAGGAAAGTVAAATTTTIVAPGASTPVSLLTAARFSEHGAEMAATGAAGAAALAALGAELQAAGLGFLITEAGVAARLAVL